MTVLNVTTETWPLRSRFTISRGSKTEAEVVVAELRKGDIIGRGECVPYARYGETVASVIEQLKSQAVAIGGDMTQADLQDALPAGAARNALDCALWDLRAKLSEKRVWQLAGLSEPIPVVTAFTLSMGEPDAMFDAAKNNAHRPVLKLKLGGAEDLARVAAVRSGAPDAKIIVDANEGWTRANYEHLLPVLTEHKVSMIEQPFPAASDAVLEELDRPIPVCADESCHDTASLQSMRGKYDVANIKLDKTGGLTQALALRDAARDAGFKIMVGCMVGTSLAMAPGVLLAQGAEIVDLDGPLLLDHDRSDGLVYDNATVQPSAPELWG